MPMKFIVDQMTGNSPVSHYPQNEATKQKQKKSARARIPIPDDVVRKASEMSKKGMTWIVISETLGFSQTGLRRAIKKRGFL